MRCRVYQKPDGSVAVIHPNPKHKLSSETDDEFVARICAQDAPKSGLDTLPYKDLDTTDLPARVDRKDWALENNRMTVKRKP